MAPVSEIRCLLVDDDHFMREGLAAELRQMEGVALVGTAGDLGEALGHPGPVDVVLLDLGLPGTCRRTATEAVLELWPTAKVLVITAYATGPDVVQAFAEGARGYLAKNVRPQELGDALHTVAGGRTYCTPTLAGHLLNAGLRLTPAERGVLRHVAEGLTDRQVAAVMNVSESTVEHRLADVRVKAGLLDRSRSLLTRFAYDCDPHCQLKPEEHEEADRRLRVLPRAIGRRKPGDRHLRCESAGEPTKLPEAGPDAIRSMP